METRIHTSGKTDWRILLFLVFPVIFMPLVYVRQILDPVQVPRILFLSVTLIPFLGILFLQLQKQQLSTRILSHNIFLFYLAYVLLTGISVINSLNPGEGIWVWMRTCTFFIFFSMGSLLLQKYARFPETLPKLFVMFSFIILSAGIYQLVEVLQTEALNHESSYLINSVFAHRNIFAQALLFSLPFLMMGIYKLKSIWRFLAFILIALSLVMITFLLVKSVWLALIAATVVTLITLLIFRKSFGISGVVFKKILVYTFSAVLLVMISIAVYARFNTIETFKKQTYVIENYKFGSAMERVHLWEKSIEMYTNNPIIGIGLSNWSIYLPDYGTNEMRSAEGEIIYQRPHNDFFWVLAESGLLTLIFYLLIFIAILYYLIFIIKKSENIHDKYFALFLLFFMISYGVVAMFSFPKERPTPSILLNLVFVLALIKYNKIVARKQHIKSTTVFIFLIASFFILLITSHICIKRFQGEYHTRKALVYRDDGKWQQMIDEIQKANSFYSRLDPTSTPLTWYSGLGWYNLGLMDNALSDLQAAYKANPYHMHVLNNLGTIYGIKKENQKAIDLYKDALRISSEFPDAAINLSVMLYNTGQLDSAYLILRNSKNIDTHPNYKKVLNTLVYQKIEELKETVDDRDMRVTLTRIRNSKDWMIKVHKQSIADQIQLDQHLFIEAIYMLQTEDKTIDSTRAAYLRKKYLR